MVTTNKKTFRGLFSKLLLGQNLTEEQRETITSKAEERVDRELKYKPPIIALIGISGVGKSSTINSLFGTNLEISHFKACTQKENEIKVTGRNGDLIIYDMPGLGEDIDQDEIHKKTYEKVLPNCDVVLWILAAKNRGAITFEQMILRDFIGVASIGILDRLVIGVNQVDLIDPNDWNTIGNFPSDEQEKNIKRRLADIKIKLGKVVPNLSSDRILYYSATKRYRLEDLFEAMIGAAQKRAWILYSRKFIADYKELIAPEILNLLNKK